MITVVLKRAQTGHASDSAATVTGHAVILESKIWFAFNAALGK
jgi:hypothetical protein